MRRPYRARSKPSLVRPCRPGGFMPRHYSTTLSALIVVVAIGGWPVADVAEPSADDKRTSPQADVFQSGRADESCGVDGRA